MRYTILGVLATITFSPVMTHAEEPSMSPTAFLYEGELRQSGRSLTRTCQFVFSLWRDAESTDAAAQIGDTLRFDGEEGNRDPVTILRGVFHVELDFGAEAFDPAGVWLDMQIRCPGDRRFTRLTSRVRITPQPLLQPEPEVEEQEQAEPMIPLPKGELVVISPDSDTRAAGHRSMAVGGEHNHADAAFSFAAGRGADIAPAHAGTFVWADSNSYADRAAPFSSTGADQFIIRASGGVGINTNQPEGALDVVGPIHCRGESPATLLYHNTVDAGPPDGDGFRIRYDEQYFGGDGDALIIEKTDESISNTDSGVVFMNSSAQGGEQLAMVIKGDGRVGIGTRRPDAPLHVCGDVRISGDLIADLNVACPDYVFEEDYALASLDEVRAFITEHGHLPDVPSGESFKAQGVGVVETQMLLLRKIEELTLYAIEQKETAERLAKRNEALEDRLVRIERLLDATDR